jgi:hypothetical protein
VHPSLRVRTLVLPALLARVATATALLIPEGADPITHLQIRDARSQLDNLSRRLVTRDDRRLQRKHTVVHVHVRAAHSARANADEHLSGGRLRIGQIPDFPWLIESSDDGCAHSDLRNWSRSHRAVMGRSTVGKLSFSCSILRFAPELPDASTRVKRMDRSCAHTGSCGMLGFGLI